MQKLSLLIYLWNITKICFICIKPASRAPQCSHICCVRAIWYGCSPRLFLPPTLCPLLLLLLLSSINGWQGGREGHTARGFAKAESNNFVKIYFPWRQYLFLRVVLEVCPVNPAPPRMRTVCVCRHVWLFQPSPPPQEMKEVPRNGRSHAEDLLPYKTIPTYREKAF